MNTPDGRPFLKRENAKRGIIRNICETRIRFVEVKKSYDFFANDANAVTLTEDDAMQASSGDPNHAPGSIREEPADVELDENLTGKDLLRLVPNQFANSSSDAGHSTFDEEDLKEGAYLVCPKRLRGAMVRDGNLRRAVEDKEVSLPAEAVGRIDKRAGFRHEPLWIVDMLPDSAPRPLWQSLFPFRRPFGEPDLVARTKVILPSSQVLEINYFLDQSGVSSTRFREVARQTDVREKDATRRLPEIYGPPGLPLEENLAIAQRNRTFAAIQDATLGLRLAFKNREVAARRSTLVLEEGTRDDSHDKAVPALFRRQCFLGLDKLGNSQENATDNSVAPALTVTGVDVKVFRPQTHLRVASTYYAIELELLLRPNFGSKEVPLICRFPWALIDPTLVDMAERILISQFEVQKKK